jgi:hypothetical protein
MVRRYLRLPSPPGGPCAASPSAEQSPSRMPTPTASATTPQNDEPRQPESLTSCGLDATPSEPVHITHTTTRSCKCFLSQLNDMAVHAELCLIY